MPLDPMARTVLDQLAALGAPPITEQSVAAVRETFEASRALVGEPEKVRSVEDLTIPGPAGPIPVRVYEPIDIPIDGADSDRPLPALVYFHGGGWVIGSLETHDGWCRAIANRAGCVVISVDYRLAPEHRFPAAIDDAWAAVQWVATNANAITDSIAVDPTRLAIAGDSAGGNLAAVAARRARDAGGPPIVFQALVYPVCNCSFETPSYAENADGYMLTKGAMEWFWAHYLDGADGLVPDASPLQVTDLTGLPPALVITAEFDPLRDEGEAYADRLRDAGVPTKITRYDGMIHGFVGMALVLAQGGQALDEIGAALRDAFAAA